MQIFARHFFRLLALLAIFALPHAVFSSAVFAQESTAQTASSQTAGPQAVIAQNIGVIDMQQILRQSDALATIRQTLDEQNVIFQKDMTAKEEELREIERALKDQKDTIDEDEFNKRRADFQSKVLDVQRAIQIQQSNFDRSIKQVQAQLHQELLKIVSVMGQERQLSMVIRRENLVIFNTAIDLTDEALLRLNERTKNMTVTFEQDDQ